MADVVEKPMAQRERQELRRIAKARFEIIEQGLEQRKREAANMIREELEAEKAEALKQAEGLTEALKAKTESLEKEAKDIVKEMAKLGITPDRYSRRGNYQAVLLSISLMDNWTPTNLDTEVQKRVDKMLEDSGLAKLNLRVQELEIMEEITVGAIQSTEGRALLNRIPKLDQLLPLPGQKKKSLKA